jgi:hypothetical protein
MALTSASLLIEHNLARAHLALISSDAPVPLGVFEACLVLVFQEAALLAAPGQQEPRRM